MENVSCKFVSLDGSQEPFAFTVYSYDLSGGFVEFDGYYYVEEAEFTKRYTLEISNEAPLQIEIYKKEVYEDTSVFRPHEVDSSITICLCKKARHKIFFR